MVLYSRIKSYSKKNLSKKSLCHILLRIKMYEIQNFTQPHFAFDLQKFAH